jgi:phosphate transport system substrate-binding protein
MKQKSNTVFFVLGMVFITFFSCKGTDNSKETILTGTTSILVDETFLPIIEDQVAVFQSQYNAKIQLISKSEKEGVLSFIKNKSGAIILSRKLNKEENTIFKNKKIIPKETPFAIDAIALIKNNKCNDSLIDVADILSFIKGNRTKIRGLVFDNPNSSTVRYFSELSGIKSLSEDGVFSFKTNEEVIKYVSQNEGMVGVLGINWLFQPNISIKKYLENITILSVKDKTTSGYVYPSQENIANRKYPLARVLYIINCQGYDGLGMGFSSFIAGETGQRIILKSGLAPMREPNRNIRIRNKIENN